jgi:hypothetical protein
MKAYLLISGTLFGLLAIVHVIRVLGSHRTPAMRWRESK